MRGIKEKETRSGLYFEGYRILKEKRPKYSIIENVKNLTSKRFKEQFESILKDLANLGYNNYWKILNAKDYGIPQNRERLFIVSIRKDVDNKSFKFPEKIPLKTYLKDLLEKEVEEKYYLSEKGIARIIYKNNKLVRNKFELPNTSACITAGYHKMSGRDNQYVSEKNKQPFILINAGTKEGYIKANIGDSINYSYINNKKRRRVGKGISQTILTSPAIATLEKLEKPIKKLTLTAEDGKTYLGIRRLTPRECWRLMDFDDTDFNKCKLIGISDTQLYRQAGNSIVVRVLEYIFKELLENNSENKNIVELKKVA